MICSTIFILYYSYLISTAEVKSIIKVKLIHFSKEFCGVLFIMFSNVIYQCFDIKSEEYVDKPIRISS